MPISSGTSKKRIASSPRPIPPSMASSASAWARLRGKPSSTKPALRIRARQSLLDHRDRQLVGHEPAGGHDLADLLAELGAFRLRGAEHVTGRDVRDPVFRSDALGLRALAGPLRAEDEEIHRRKPS